MQGTLKIGLVLCSPADRPIPSTRIAVLNLLPHLRDRGFEFNVLFSPAEPNETPDLTGVADLAVQTGCRIVVLQKVRGASAVALARHLEAARVKTVFFVCDVIDPAMVEATTATVTVTNYLRSLYPFALQSRIQVVHDGIEHPEFTKLAVLARRGSLTQPIRAVLVTSSPLATLPLLEQLPPWLRVSIVGRYPPRTAWIERLRMGRWIWDGLPDPPAKRAFTAFLLDPRVRCVPWHPRGVYEELMSADIGIIPVDTKLSKAIAREPAAWTVKSENRLTLMMAVGLPVIATPIPSYIPLVREGENAFLASTLDDWSSALETLRDPAVRRRIGQSARDSVLSNYSIERQAGLVADLFFSLLDYAR